MDNHPNIMKYLNDYEFNGKKYIVIELIETENLPKLIREYQVTGIFIQGNLILKHFSQLVTVLKYC
jgi:serine/threonine protein kinase